MYDQLDGPAWSLTGSTGTMAASLAANSLVFAMGAIANSSPTNTNAPKRGGIEIEGIQLVFTAIVASATPVAAGRALRLFKASDSAQAMPTGGSAISPLPKRTLDQTADTGLQGGQALISTTTGLTAGTFTRGTVPLATMDLVGAGAAANRIVFEFYEKRNGAPLWLDPGEILVISNPAAFDAVLTWQLTVNVDYRSRDVL